MKLVAKLSLTTHKHNLFQNYMTQKFYSTIQYYQSIDMYMFVRCAAIQYVLNGVNQLSCWYQLLVLHVYQSIV